MAGSSALALRHRSRVNGLQLWLLLLPVILFVSLLGYDRLAGVCGVAWTVSVQLPIAVGPYPALLISSLIPLVGFIVMIITPRHRRRDLRRLGWLAPVIAIAAITQPYEWGFGALGIAYLIALSLAGAIILIADPRPLMAAALVWTSIGMTYAGWPGPAASPQLLLTSSAPITLLIINARSRKLRQRTN